MRKMFATALVCLAFCLSTNTTGTTSAHNHQEVISEVTNANDMVIEEESIIKKIKKNEINDTVQQQKSNQNPDVNSNKNSKMLIKKWIGVIEAIAQVESKGNPKVISKNGRYVGYLQISEILVRQVNIILGKQVFSYNDRLNKDKSIEMFIIFQEHYNKEGNMEKAIRLWNSGDLNCMKNKNKTNAYYNKVMSKYTTLSKL